LGIGMNYAAHAAESGAEPPTRPVVFVKLPNTVVGPNDPIVIPRRSTTTGWEVELGVVIGRRTPYLSSPGEALDHVAGFCTANDVSERTFQFEESGGQWSKGKSCASFTPIGPVLVTRDEVDHRAPTPVLIRTSELRDHPSGRYALPAHPQVLIIAPGRTASVMAVSVGLR
jgi:2,4-diketo-3-deoxy-L-fuconate hydrolase